MEFAQTPLRYRGVAVSKGLKIRIVVCSGYLDLVLTSFWKESPKLLASVLSNNLAVGLAEFVLSFRNWNVFEGVIAKERPEDSARFSIDAYAKKADFQLNILDRTKSNQLACPALRTFKHHIPSFKRNRLRALSSRIAAVSTLCVLDVF